MSLGQPWRRRLNSLRLRVLLTVLIGATLFAALAGTLAYRLAHDRAREVSHATLQSLAATVEKTLAIGTFAGDQVLLREVVDGLARNELVAGVAVLGASGQVLADNRRPGRAASGGSAVLRPLQSPFDPDERIGTLRIVADQARVDAAASTQAYTLAALMAVQAGLLALLLYGLADRLVSRPIIALARDLHAIAPGTPARLSIPASHRDDEIGRLMAGANALLDATSLALDRERALRAEVEAMEAQYRQIFDSSSAGIFVLDSQGRMINGNPTVSRVVGMSLAQLRELRRDNFIHRVFGQPEQVQRMMAESARLGETVSADLELVQQGDKRRWVHCLISVQAHAPAQAGRPGAQAPTVEGVIYDITERKRAERAARYRASHDPLTGLRNRAAGQAGVSRLIAEAKARGATLSLLCIDLDGFKRVNDELGHPAGDRVLVACAERMRAVVRRSTDLLARLGGDEFLVALRDVGPADAVLGESAAALLAALCEPVTLADGTVARVGASIGIACLPRHGGHYGELVAAADEAMYGVKRSGKNSYAMAIGPIAANPVRADAGRPATDTDFMVHDEAPTRPADLSVTA